jgi:cyclophilin family peptidyl-prolyl cis-trans isomerase
MGAGCGPPCPAGCGGALGILDGATTKHSKPFPMTIDKSGNYSASMRTSCGTMQIQLFARQSPLTVNNFVNLSEEGWYDGLIFHRVNNDIDIIQTGDPYCVTQPSQCGSGGPGYSFPDELKNGLSLKVGSVAMANSGPDTNGSQIFIITGPAGTTLPPNYTVFGQVTKGMDVAKKIQGVPVGGSAGDTPLEQIWIDSVKIDQSK